MLYKLKIKIFPWDYLTIGEIWVPKLIHPFRSDEWDKMLCVQHIVSFHCIHTKSRVQQHWYTIKMYLNSNPIWFFSKKTNFWDKKNHEFDTSLLSLCVNRSKIKLIDSRIIPIVEKGLIIKSTIFIHFVK